MTYSSIHNSFREQNTGSTIEIRMSSSIDLISGSHFLSNISGYHQTTNRITESVLIVNINHDALQPDVAQSFFGRTVMKLTNQTTWVMSQKSSSLEASRSTL